jgi:hypothetical protein
MLGVKESGMKVCSLAALGLGLCAISCASDSTGPISGIRNAKLADLTILSVTYSYDLTVLGWPSTDFTLWIRNIGKAPFTGLLYVSWTRDKYSLRQSQFSNTSLINYDWGGESVIPKMIAPGQVIEDKISSPGIPDTTVVRFHIQTDHRGLRLYRHDHSSVGTHPLLHIPPGWGKHGTNHCGAGKARPKGGNIP